MTWLKGWIGRSVEFTGGLTRRHAGKLIILTFHRVRPGGEDQQTRAMRILDVRTSDFRRLLAWMRKRYEPVALGDWLSRHVAPAKPSFAITFDDGWADNYQNAYPVLQELGLPATIFLSTAAVDERQPFWWQRPGLTDAEIEQMKERQVPWVDALQSGHLDLRKEHDEDFLRWEHIQEMAKGGRITFGLHGHRHALMDRLTRDEALEDIRRCHELLVQHVPDGWIPVLAWPNGNARFDIILEMKSLGLQAALGTQSGAATTPSHSRWNLPRVNVDRNVSRHSSLWPWMLMRAR